MKKRTVAAVGVGTLTLVFAAVGLSGCGSNQDDGVVTVNAPLSCHDLALSY